MRDQRIERIDRMVAALVTGAPRFKPEDMVTIASALIGAVDRQLAAEGEPCTCTESPGALCPRCHAGVGR
jgi:hypothetical protein